MKYLLILIFLIPVTAHARRICIDVPDADIVVMEDIVVDSREWIVAAVKGKIASCKERVVNKEIKQSIENDEALPAGRDAIIQKYLSRPDYKNRRQREAEKGRR